MPADEQAAVAVVQELLALLRSEPETAASLGELDEAQLLAHLVQRARRQADLDRLRAAVEDPGSTEGDLQKIVEGMTWIFGGEFLPRTAQPHPTRPARPGAAQARRHTPRRRAEEGEHPVPRH
ncbi:hypothetical protein PV371_11695 [Streptomyces sp. TX20-6-3]|uniref:hypothetical protein n=1 Tax=Streptomyces sp. TX20-6-3 TaxID=3028705 RepID=UPI0029AF2F36|nr:hypothetical protein [Streptomyces sp. TX20-6-3]MDX2560307.1 hypothetical protein [Streptomyces sp. TX20-6-3]